MYKFRLISAETLNDKRDNRNTIQNSIFLLVHILSSPIETLDK